MSEREAWKELNELRRKTNKAKHRTMSEHAQDLDPLTAYTHMFDPMGALTEMLNDAHIVKAKIMLMRDPGKKAFCLTGIDSHILGLERHMARWQGQDQIMFDEHMIPGRPILYGEKQEDYSDLPGLDDL